MLFRRCSVLWKGHVGLKDGHDTCTMVPSQASPLNNSTRHQQVTSKLFPRTFLEQHVIKVPKENIARFCETSTLGQKINMVCCSIGCKFPNRKKHSLDARCWLAVRIKILSTLKDARCKHAIYPKGRRRRGINLPNNESRRFPRRASTSHVMQ